MKLFDIESPFMQKVFKATDLLWLNLLTVLCSLPIFTIGAAQAGLYYAMARLQKDEGTVTRDFFRGFGSNFAKATVLWLIWLAAAVVIVYAALFYVRWKNLPMAALMVSAIMVFLAAVIWVLSYPWVFPLQVHFENTIKNTAKNAIACGFSNLFPTLGMAVLNLLPVIVWLAAPYYFWMLGLVWICIWYAMAAYFNTKTAKQVFKKLTDPEE